MSTIIQSLKLTSETRPNRVTAVVHRRNKLIGHLRQQIEAATADQKGEPYVININRRIRNKETGEVTEVSRQRRIRADWWISSTGKVCLEMRYGTHRVEIAKGKSVIEIEHRSKLVPTLETLIAAVAAGELDHTVAEAIGTYARPIGKVEKKSTK